MVALTETTIAMAFAAVAVVGTIVWYALAWYGISALRDIRDAVEDENGRGG